MSNRTAEDVKLLTRRLGNTLKDANTEMGTTNASWRLTQYRIAAQLNANRLKRIEMKS